jgi:predicted transcriptional regulator of viral defense system
VKELSSKLGVKNQNVHVWFSSTGKKLGTIQRIGAGRYRLKPGA